MLPQRLIEDYTYFGTVILRNGRINQAMANRIIIAHVYYQVCDTVAQKRKVESKVKLHIMNTVNLHTIVTVAVMKCLQRVAGRTRRELIRNKRIGEELGVSSIKDRKTQMKQFGHISRMRKIAILENSINKLGEMRDKQERHEDIDFRRVWIEAPRQSKAPMQMEKKKKRLNYFMCLIKAI